MSERGAGGDGVLTKAAGRPTRSSGPGWPHRATPLGRGAFLPIIDLSLAVAALEREDLVEAAAVYGLGQPPEGTPARHGEVGASCFAM